MQIFLKHILIIDRASHKYHHMNQNSQTEVVHNEFVYKTVPASSYNHAGDRLNLEFEAKYLPHLSCYAVIKSLPVKDINRENERILAGLCTKQWNIKHYNKRPACSHIEIKGLCSHIHDRNIMPLA